MTTPSTASPAGLQITRPGQRPYRIITVYGPTGAGKSWFGASAESKLGGRTLILGTEGAEAGLEGFDIDHVPITNMAELHKALRNLKENDGRFLAADGKFYGPYKVVVLDSLSQMEQFALAVDSDEQHKQGNTKTPLNIPIDSYKRVGEDIRRSVWYIRTLPMHFVLICLDRLFQSKDGTVRTVGPNLSEKLSGSIRAYSDVVAYMTAELRDLVSAKGEKLGRKLIRMLYLQPGEDFAARVRAGKGVVVPEYIAEPTIEKVLAIFKTPPQAEEERKTA